MIPCRKNTIGNQHVRPASRQPGETVCPFSRPYGLQRARRAFAASWAPRIKDNEARKAKSGLVKMCLENHAPALAMTDHGVMGGAIEFYEEMGAAGIKKRSSEARSVWRRAAGRSTTPRFRTFPHSAAMIRTLPDVPAIRKSGSGITGPDSHTAPRPVFPPASPESATRSRV